jgi:hypothetical protein
MVNVKILFDSKKAKVLKSCEKEIILKGDFSYLFIRTPTSDLTLPVNTFDTISILGQDLRIVYVYGEKVIQGDVEFIIVCGRSCCKRYLLTTDSIYLVDDTCHKRRVRNYGDEWYEHWFYPYL